MRRIVRALRRIFHITSGHLSTTQIGFELDSSHRLVAPKKAQETHGQLCFCTAANDQHEELKKRHVDAFFSWVRDASSQ